MVADEHRCRRACLRIWALGTSLLALAISGCSSDSSDPGTAPQTAPVLEAVAGDRSVELSWQGVPGSMSYTLFWSTTPDGVRSGTQVFGATSPFVHSELVNLTTYYYAVAASNENGTGPLSAVVA